MSQYRDDLDPPPEIVRNNLSLNTNVKLLFRFAAEDTARADGQTERMWVLVSEIDEGEYYIGTLENDPHHANTLACGDPIRFHPLHVMAILDEDGP